MIPISLLLKDGILITFSQNQVENIALEVLGTHYRIFFDKIPITDKFYLIWEKLHQGWVLKGE